MTTLLPFFVLVCIWIALPLALQRPARHLGLPPETAALCLCAAGAAVAALALLPQEPLSIVLARDRAYQDISYTLARNHHVAAASLSLLAVGGIALVLRGLIHRRPALILLKGGHWLVHAAAGILILPSLQVLPMPRRYIDYPEVFFWQNLAANAGSALLLLGLAAILLAPLAALLIRARQG